MPVEPRTVHLSPTRLATLFAFGAVVISIFDGFHTHSGTTRYPHPVAFEAAWWTPLIFGASTGLGGPAFALVYRVSGGKRPPPSAPSLAVAFAIFGALYAFSGFYHGASATSGSYQEANLTKLLVLGLGALALYLWLDRTVAGAVATLATALTGPLIEIVLVHAGAFEHLQPDVLGIPCWLPALYACSAPAVGHGSRWWLSE
jgi:hypothetical protein